MGLGGRILLFVVSSCIEATSAAASSTWKTDHPTQMKELPHESKIVRVLDEVEPSLRNAKDLSSPLFMPSIADEGHSIRPIDLTFKQRPADWGQEGHGISMDSTGEPKSGTTWTERIITELALQLCGSNSNAWCKMGRLEVHPAKPDPYYIWEMINVDTENVYVHFDGTHKHPIPGFDIEWSCIPLGHRHPNGFARRYPCNTRGSYPSREQLQMCLPRVSSTCSKLMPSRYPDVRRMAVVFRDPRDVVISSRRYQVEVQHKVMKDIVLFIQENFEMIVAWQHQRWAWHTTFYRDVSHLMFYEDLKANSSHLVNLARFMGLDCSLDQAHKVWKMHIDAPHGGYEVLKLPEHLVKYMNITMSTLLPERMLLRYGLPFTHS